jgi:L-alanine-DL-glutamate epimerase-like enolase superfamily enzyme
VTDDVAVLQKQAGLPVQRLAGEDQRDALRDGAPGIEVLAAAHAQRAAVLVGEGCPIIPLPGFPRPALDC